MKCEKLKVMNLVPLPFSLSCVQLIFFSQFYNSHVKLRKLIDFHLDIGVHRIQFLTVHIYMH